MEAKSVVKRIVTNRWVIAAAGVVALYTLLGFFLLPYLTKRYLTDYVEQDLQRQIEIKAVRFNPFTFVLEAEGGVLEEKDGSPLAGFSLFTVNFDPFTSVFRRAWTFADILLADPKVHLILRQNGRLNLVELVGKKKDTQDQPQQADGGLPRILLQQVALRQGQIVFEDRRETPPAEVNLNSISVELNEISTLPDQTGGYSISGTTQAGERLKWRGDLALNPLRSQGAFEIGRVQAATVWAFFKNRLAVEKPPGEITVAGEYALDLSGRDTAFSLRNVSIDAADLGITSRGGQSPLFSLRQAEARGGEVSLGDRAITLERLRLNGGRVRVKADQKGLAGWNRLIEKETPVEPQRKQNTTAEKSADQWSASLQSLSINDFKAELADLTTEPTVDFVLDPLNLTAEGISTDPDARVKYTLQTSVKQGGKIHASGETRPWKPSVAGELEISGFSLLPLQPYLSRFVQLKLDSGSLATSGTFGYGKKDGTETFTFQGRGEITSVQAQAESADQPVWGWQSLSSPDIKVSLMPNRLELKDVKLTDPSGALIIYEDRTVNLSHLMVPQKAKGEPQTDAQRNDPKNDQTSGDRKDDNAFTFTVDRVQVAGGELKFEDLSLRPQFGTLIHELQGALSGISSVSGTVAGVDLEGRVDAHGQAKIDGQTDLFNPTGKSELTVDFRNIDMTNLTPYSMRFAGYRIDSGKLDLDLKYNIQNGKMVGRNQIIAQKLTLGKRVESSSALDIPIELAIALLKDSSDTIDIGLPVSGDLNNPKFDFGDVIGQALAKLLKKVVTAPFSWLAALVGSDKEDLGRIAFDPGVMTLSPPQEEKLVNLSKALGQRPGLTLLIRGGYNSQLDVPALKDVMLKERIAAAMGREQETGPAAGSVVFHNPETQQAIESLFPEYYPDEQLSELKSNYEQSLSPDKKDLAADERAAAWADFYSNLYQRIKGKMEISETQLKAFAEKRAASIVTYLVKKGDVDPGRVKRLEPEQTDAEDKEVISKLSIDTGK